MCRTSGFVGWQFTVEKDLMMADTLKSSTQLEKLKCALCKNSLSYFPIKICENGQNICGRCSPPDEATASKYIHNEAYETAAYFLQFPCRYKNEGCEKSMSPEEVPNHEKICGFQVVTCAVKKRTCCDWEGSLPKILQHCQQQHGDLFLKNGEFEMDLSKSYDFENFMEHEDMLVVITRKFSSMNNGFFFSVTYFEFKNLYYQISFTNMNKSLHIDGNGTVFIEDQADNNKIFLDSLENLNKDLPSRIFVKITFDKAVEQEQISSEKNLYENMLSQLKCSKCSHYVIPPIYCSQDQVYCSDCKMKFSIACETRNVSLDKLATLLDYPCKYWKNGCSFICKPDQMEKHQRFCLKGIYPCLLKEYSDCNWEGSGEDFVMHLQQKHSNIIVTNSSEITENSDKFVAKSIIKSDVTFDASAVSATLGLSFTSSNTFNQPSMQPCKPKLTTSIFSSNSSNTFGQMTPVSMGGVTLTQSGKFSLGFPTLTQSGNVSNTGKDEENFFEKCYIISFLTHLFRVNFAVKRQTYYWTVQAIGNFAEKFKYELEIIDKTGRGRKILAKQRCSSLTKHDEIFKNREFCCFFPTSCLKSLLSPQNDITFKIRIVK